MFLEMFVILPTSFLHITCTETAENDEKLRIAMYFIKQGLS